MKRKMLVNTVADKIGIAVAMQSENFETITHPEAVQSIGYKLHAIGFYKDVINTNSNHE